MTLELSGRQDFFTDKIWVHIRYIHYPNWY